MLPGQRSALIWPGEVSGQISFTAVGGMLHMCSRGVLFFGGGTVIDP